MSAATIVILTLLTPALDLRGANAPAADSAKARELVAQLGDSKFKVRDAAERGLVQLGMASLAALKEGETSADIHVQERCKALQPTIRALTLQKRIDAFITNGPNAPLKDLPFAGRFIQMAGDSKESRELYGELLQAHASLLDEIDQDKGKAKAIFANYCQEVTARVRYQRGVDYAAIQRSIKQPDVLLYLLLTGEFNNGQNAGYTFLNAPIMSDTLAKSSAKDAAFKNIFMAWLEKEQQSFLVQRGLQVAVDAKMPEALPLALKLVKNKDLPGATRAQTALLIGKVGSKENLKDIAPFLDDKTVVGNFNINNINGSVQLRDAALAASIKLSGQKFANYDFDVLNGGEEFVLSNYIYCAFSNDEKREAAHRKFKASNAKEMKK